MKPRVRLIWAIVTISLAVVVFVGGIILVVDGYLSGLGSIAAGLIYGPISVYNYRRRRQLAAKSNNVDT